MTVVMLLTTPWSWSWWLKIVAWLQSTNCLCAWNTTVKLSSLHNYNLLWIKICGKQRACICLILPTSLKTFWKAGFLARYLRVHACYSSGVHVPIPAWSTGDRRDQPGTGAILGDNLLILGGICDWQLQRKCLEITIATAWATLRCPMGFFYCLDTGIDCIRQYDRRSR